MPAIFLVIGVVGLVFFGKKNLEKSSPLAATTPETQNADGLLVLKSGQRRGFAFIFLTLFALVWNGVVWGVWGLTHTFLFVIFAGVGVFVAVLAIREFLALFNPLPVLGVNRQQIAPGETLRVEWKLRGNIQRVRRLRISL